MLIGVKKALQRRRTYASAYCARLHMLCQTRSCVPREVLPTRRSSRGRPCWATVPVQAAQYAETGPVGSVLHLGRAQGSGARPFSLRGCLARKILPLLSCCCVPVVALSYNVRPCLPRAIQSSVLGSWNSVMANAVNSQDLTQRRKDIPKTPAPSASRRTEGQIPEQERCASRRTSLKSIGVLLERNMSSRKSHQDLAAQHCPQVDGYRCLQAGRAPLRTAQQKPWTQA